MTPVAAAVDAYIRAWAERDPAARAALVERCFAADGRIVMPASEIRGRAALEEAMARLLADPEVRGVRITTAIDARGTIFRFGTAIDRRDGTSLEAFDAGEIDANGRIAVLLTFSGPLQATLGAAG